MLGSHSQIYTHPEPHLITPLAYLGFHDTVDKAPYDHINAAQAMRAFVGQLPRERDDYLDAVRAYADTLYGRMLEPSGRRYFLDKTPAYGTVLPFLTELYPDARYVVLTRHPFAVMSSYANSFFLGDWDAALEFNDVLGSFVPSMAQLLRDANVPLVHVQYEQLVREPEAQLKRIFALLDVQHEAGAVEYGDNFGSQAKGMGDPINVHKHSRPTEDSTEKWIAELQQDRGKLETAQQIADRLDAADLETWGYPKRSLFDPLRDRSNAEVPRPPLWNNHVLQRRVMLALKKDIDKRPHGKVVRALKYYCDVLLRQ